MARQYQARGQRLLSPRPESEHERQITFNGSEPGSVKQLYCTTGEGQGPFMKWEDDGCEIRDSVIVRFNF